VDRSYVVVGVEAWYVPEKEEGDTVYPPALVPRLRLLWVEKGRVREGVAAVWHMYPAEQGAILVEELLHHFPLGSEVNSKEFIGHVMSGLPPLPREHAETVLTAPVVGYYLAYRTGRGAQAPCIFMHVAVGGADGTEFVRAEGEEAGAWPVPADEDPCDAMHALQRYLTFWMEPGADVDARLVERKGRSKGARALRRYVLVPGEGPGEGVPERVWAPPQPGVA